METPSIRAALAWTAAVLLTVVGGALFVTDGLTPTSFAYVDSQVSDDAVTSFEDIVVFSRSGAIGGVLLTAGLVALAYLVGAQIGARRTRSHQE